ncbi:hypothetical protein [Streptomyces sp. NPDC002057]|uniref:hypothetical protein n=1 Tax=Streptomyces sp. NPDC002057 TaxID=3154664 RepID=UPI003331E8D5
MDFDLAPPNGVGPLRIGMTRHAADTALDSLRVPSAISESDRSGQHVFRPGGLMISIRCARDMLAAIELGRPSSQTSRSSTSRTAQNRQSKRGRHRQFQTISCD